MVQQQYQRGIGRFATILKETGEFIGWTEQICQPSRRNKHQFMIMVID
jgi:hypothetical protein